MQVRCVAAFGDFVPGDLSEVPDGAQVSELYWEPVAPAPAIPPPTAAAAVKTADTTPKAGM